jgi:hypothetical protein
MAMVLIKCPTTDLPVSTGLFMAESEFESAAFQEEARRLSCPLCNEVHVWQKDQAYLVEEEEPLTGA